MKNLLLLFTALFTLVGCNTSKKNMENSASFQEPFSYPTIENNKVGNFEVGSKIEEVSGYKILKTMEHYSTEDGDIYVPTYIVRKDDENLLNLIPKYDDSAQKYTDIIGEVIVISPNIKTNKKIGIGSTIEEFIETYPMHQLWFTYISNSYVIESEELEIQFILDENDHIGEMEIDGDLTELNKNNFKPESKIKSIRIYNK